MDTPVNHRSNADATRLPALFISHGSPMFALEPGLAGPALRAVGEHFTHASVKAVLVVSAHWMTRGGVGVSSASQPETIHDFGGFPPALYQLQYPAAGAPDIAARTLAVLQAAGFPAQLDSHRGLDHGAWVPLMHLLPDASLPVFQVSLPYPIDTAGALALGQALAPLRDEGVLIIGSGSLTHNLRDMRPPSSGAESYVVAFTDWIRNAVLDGDIAQLRDYRRRAPHAERAHPSEEHFLPLLVAMGAMLDDDPIEVIDGGVEYAALSMESYVFGQLAAA